MKQKLLLIFFAVAALFLSIGEKAYAAGLVVCGKESQKGTADETCSLCHIILQINVLIHYIVYDIGMIFMVVLIMGGAAMYIFSGGNPGLAETGKKAIYSAIVGFVIILLAFVIVNSIIQYLGADGNNLGLVNVTSWGDFNCAPQAH